MDALAAIPNALLLDVRQANRQQNEAHEILLLLL
jgi:hypothetical protein